MSRTLPVYHIAGLAFIILLSLLVVWLFPLASMLLAGVGLAVTIAGAFYTGLLAVDSRVHVFPLSLLVLSFVLVFLTGSGPFWHDSGEIASAIWSMGVAHPTGFPVVMLGGKAFSLLPLGNAFFRINLFETFSLIIAGVLVALLTRSVYKTEPHGVFVGVLGFLLSGTVLMHGMNTEVYIPSVVGLAVGLLLFEWAYLHRDSRAFVAGAFVLGLGLGGHVTWPLHLGVAALVIVGAAILKRRTRVPMVPMVVALAVGMLIVLYLPAVAARGPVRNWGNPSTLQAMLAHVTGSSIRHGFSGEISGFLWPRFRIHLGMFVRQVASDQFAILPLAFIGLWPAFKRSPLMAASLLAILLSDVFFTAQINPMGIIDRQTGVSTELVIAVLAGTGGAWIFDVLTSRLHTPVLVPWLILAAFSLAQWLGMPMSPWYNRSHGPEMVISSALDTAPPDCTLLTSSDDLSGLLIAGRVVEERRPDCLHLVKQHMLLSWHVDYEFKRAGRRIPWQHRKPLVPYQEVRKRMEEVIASSPGPVYFEPGQPWMDALVDRNIVPGYPLYKVTHDKNVSIHRRALRAATAAVLTARHSLDTGRRVVAGFLTSLSVVLNRAGDVKDAMVISRLSVKVSPTNEKALYNRAVFEWWYESHRKRAIRLLQRAIALRPDYARALKRLAEYASRLHRNTLAHKARLQYQAVTGKPLQ